MIEKLLNDAFKIFEHAERNQWFLYVGVGVVIVFFGFIAWIIYKVFF